MAFKIVASRCTACGACEFECPSKAIKLKGEVYAIDPDKCTECEGAFETQQCNEVCPVPKTCMKAA